MRLHTAFRCVYTLYIFYSKINREIHNHSLGEPTKNQILGELACGVTYYYERPNDSSYQILYVPNKYSKKQAVNVNWSLKP